MRLRLTTFNGEIPKMHRTMLPEGYAQHSLNTDHQSQTAKPLQANLSVYDNGGVKAPDDFYLHLGQTWLVFDQEVDVVRGPSNDDRLYISRALSSPILKIMPTGTEYPLALPTPPAPAVTSIHTAATPPDEPLEPGELPPVIETVSYAYTWVSIFDEETVPSPPSLALDVAEGDTVLITFIDQPPTASRINRLRLYRTQTGASGITEFQFVKELNSATTAFVHDLDADPLQEVLPSTFYEPPVTGLHGFTALHNGMVAAFKDKTLHFCEPYRPHAWPSQYQLVTDYEIVALVAFGPILAVLTTGNPYIVQGTAPENLILERIEQNTPCLSKDGVVDLGYAAAFPSTEGLVTLAQSGAQIITRNLFTRKQWRDMRPETFSAGQHNGRYVFSYTPLGSESRHSAIIDLADQATISRPETAPLRLKQDIYTGALHFVQSGSPLIFEYAAESQPFLSQTWESAEFLLPTETSFGVILVEGESLDRLDAMAVSVYRDGCLHHRTDMLNAPDRLPAGLGRRWSIKIEGKVEISRVSIAGTMQEIWA